MSDFDLDTDAPTAVADVLRIAAERYREAVDECEESTEGPVWCRFARIMERAARACDRTVKRWGA
jgi:hypothetical protein